MPEIEHGTKARLSPAAQAAGRPFRRRPADRISTGGNIQVFSGMQSEV